MFTHNYFIPVCFVPQQNGPQPAEVIRALLDGHKAVQAARAATPTTPTANKGR